MAKTATEWSVSCPEGCSGRRTRGRTRGKGKRKPKGEDDAAARRGRRVGACGGRRVGRPDDPAASWSGGSEARGPASLRGVTCGVPKQKRRPIGGALFRMVPEARVELARLSTKVFETSASAIPPLGHGSLSSIAEASNKASRILPDIRNAPACEWRFAPTDALPGRRSPRSCLRASPRSARLTAPSRLKPAGHGSAS